MSADPDLRGCHCGDLAAKAIAEASGRDVWAELGGRPQGWLETAALYRRHGCRSLADVMTHLLGSPVPPKQARRGDVVMFNGALGVCRGEVAEFVDATHPMRKVDQAWHASR